MAQQTINLGTVPDDGTGDTLRAGGDKINDNFDELYDETLKLKGSTDCSANPNYPAALKGDSYRVSVAGKIGGASGVSVEVGDRYYALADNAGGTQASVGTSWDVLQGNIVGSTGVDVEDEGTPEASGVTVLNFTGTGVTATDAGGGQVDINIPGGTGGIDVEDEGVSEATGVTTLNFTGAGVVASDAGGGVVDVTIAGGGSGIDVEDEGVSEATGATTLNFVGAGVTAADVGGGVVDVTISGSAFSGALVHKAADQTTANFSAGFAAVAWDDETSGYDTDSYHDTVTNNSRLTIPANGKYVFRAAISAASGTLTASDYIRMLLTKNGSVATAIHGGFHLIAEISATPTVALNGVSAPITCVAGDFFELSLDTESDTSITVTAIGSWFSVERVA